MEVRDQRDRLEALGAVAIAVGFSPADALAALAAELAWPWPFLSDPDRVLYARLGLERAPRRAVYNPGTLNVYRKAVGRGVPLKRPVEDVRQLGGDAVVNDGRVVRVFRPASPDDRAPVEALLAAVSEAAGEA
ncbi:MAG: hypothetical protein M3N28_06990 [Actinomycetota bacterium]|nr:hypothetical protein [Actinomycetota bacterium]